MYFILFQEETHFSILDLLSSQLDHSADFGGNAEVFEEPLVSRPELAPHGLLHALLCIHQICSLLELLPCGNPLGEAGEQIYLITASTNKRITERCL